MKKEKDSTTDSAWIDSLKTIYETLETIEHTRKSPDINPEEKLVLEKSAVSLRKKEREIIGEQISAMIKKITPQSENLETLTGNIRKRVKNMGKAPKTLDNISKILLEVVKIADRTGTLIPEKETEK